MATPETHPVIFEEFFRWHVSPEKLDRLLANGWRRFAQRFYRYSFFLNNDSISRVQPLRIVLDQFTLSKSQSRVLRRNSDVKVRISKARIDDVRRELFENHRQRFRENAPPSLEEYLGARPDQSPCETLELGVYQKGTLLAASYLDLGKIAVSSVYGMFDLAASRRSLGTLTMLLEMAFARSRGCQYYYPGYSLDTPSMYDYKKKFSALEWFDWQGNWAPLQAAASE